MEKNNKTVLIVISSLLLIGGGIAGYIFWRKYKSKKDMETFKNTMETVRKKMLDDIAKAKASPEYAEYLKKGGKPF
tara:strand:- start:261 stop:488 length:228 start_codon:yes stop_codon:yes gene_type:complete